MSRSAKVLLDTQHTSVAFWQTVEADDWTVVSGLLTLRLDGKEVAQFQHWSAVKWAPESETIKVPFQTDFPGNMIGK